MVKIAIVGNGQSGKDTAAAFIASRTGLRFTKSTSEFAAGIVFSKWGKDHYPDIKSCYDDRRNHREEWASIIHEMNLADSVRFYRECLAKEDILVGVRNSWEWEECRKAKLFEFSIYIDRPGTVDATMSIDPIECDIIIRNRGDLGDFYDALELPTSLCRLQLRREVFSW